MTNTQLSLTVNGKLHTLPPLPGETLSSLLRYRLHLTGTKIACEESECGSCTVLVDGEPVLSCNYPAVRANGRKVLTIEGLARSSASEAADDAVEGLHPLQRAFI